MVYEIGNMKCVYWRGTTPKDCNLFPTYWVLEKQIRIEVQTAERWRFKTKSIRENVATKRRRYKCDRHYQRSLWARKHRDVAILNARMKDMRTRWQLQVTLSSHRSLLVVHIMIMKMVRHVLIVFVYFVTPQYSDIVDMQQNMPSACN